MKLPKDLLQSLNGVAGFNEEAFVAVHAKEEGVTSMRVNPVKWPENERKESAASAAFTFPLTPVPWSEYGYYLEKRPSFTFDPLFHAGCYYVQEASSMFLEQVFRQLLPLTEPLKVLDLCAAPGGKSTHIQTLLSKESLLVSNEVIRSRSLSLVDNMVKWGSSNVLVTNNDPQAFQKLPGYFDVLVVDAPCSGSGLFRKDPAAVEEWSPNAVMLCSQRQQRILADALPALKEGGLLIYSTCSYSAAEDEEIMDWLITQMDLQNIALNAVDAGIVSTTSNSTGATGYRFYPDRVRGEGFFLACFRKKTGTKSVQWKAEKAPFLSAKEQKIAGKWVQGDTVELLWFRDIVIALPAEMAQPFMQLQSLLHVVYAGVAVGTLVKEKLLPHHALAQSRLVSAEVPSFELNYEEAIKYLQRNDFSAQPLQTGWQVVRYAGHNLGWVNALKNRVNNYYPKEIRILKQNNIPFTK